MAYEYTQSFQYTAVASGQTGIQYFALNASSPPANSVYILKSCYVSCPTGFTSVAGTTPSVLCYTSDDASGTNKNLFASDNPGTVASSVLDVFTALDASQGESQIISTQEYIGVNVNFTNAFSTFYVVITYIVIPGGNVLAATFNKTVGVVGAGTQSFVNASTTNVRFLKSIHFMNTTASSSFDIQLVSLNNSGTTIEGYLDYNATITGFETATFAFPFYMAPNSASIPGYVITGTGTITYYCSYCQV